MKRVIWTAITGLLVSLAANARTVDPAVKVAWDTTGAYGLCINGPAIIDGEATAYGPIGTNWTSSGTVTETHAAGGDMLKIVGTVTHLMPPHGEGVGAAIGYAVCIDATALAAGTYTTTVGVGPAAHGTHTDEGNVAGKGLYVIYTVDAAKQITSYAAKLNMNHKAVAGVKVPTVSTWGALALLLGLMTLGTIILRRSGRQARALVS